MSLEPGGRSEKYGDEYENRFLAKLLLRLVKERLCYVIVEPVGANSDSVEFVAVTKDGITEYYQCKASNGTRPAWNISDLQRYSVFTRAKTILSDSPDSNYFFISPLAYNELDELCKRVRTTASIEELINYQLTNVTIRKTFHSCTDAFNLDPANDYDQKVLFSFLSRCYFERCPDGSDAVRDLEESISNVFTGQASEVRVLLEQFSNATGKYGIKITAKDVVDYLQNLGISSRNLNYDDRILPRIEVLNKNYWDEYPAINNRLIHRDATTRIMTAVREGRSVILHGKAGSGKSGCLQETINQLVQEHILFLAVKLDKYVPSISADEFGKNLGLPTSPVYCLGTLSKNSPCVLILDQLDALRWTMSHSATSLSVCKELISQAEAFNKDSGGHISIVFSARTFDLENDSGLKSLVDLDNCRGSVEWEKICVDCFSQDDVIQITGPSYAELPIRLKKLLLTPSSLYIWTQLEEERKVNSVSSIHQMMGIWWNQILDSAEARGVPRDSIVSCKSKIVDRMKTSSLFSVPTSLFSDDRSAVSLLVSSGMIRNDGNKISFVHQSIFDYFITTDYLNKIFDGTSIVNLFQPYDSQIPQIRYQFISVLQNLIEYDQKVFVQQSIDILESRQIHYYFQCAVFEVIGQCTTPQEALLTFVDRYADQEKWSTYIEQVVIYAHPAFVKHLTDLHCDWLEDQNVSLLRSINSLDPDYVVKVLNSCTINTLKDARKIYWILCFDLADDSDLMFQFRVDLINKYPVLLDDCWGFTNLFIKNPSRVIQLFKTILDNSIEYRYKKIYFGDERELERFAVKNCESIVKEIVPSLFHYTNSLSLSWPFNFTMINDDNKDWFECVHERSVLREIVHIAKCAIAEYATKHPNDTCALIEQYPCPPSAVGHEIISHALSFLPEEYGEFAIRWLLRDFDSNVFVFTDSQEDYLVYAKRIIKNHSSACSIELFRKLEGTICFWKESNKRMRDIYKRRVEKNKTRQHQPVYNAFWGHMQKELLPCLDPKQVSPYTQALIQVLQRNTWIQIPYFYNGFTMHPARAVVSPVDNYVGQISDKRWLSIIATPNEKMGSHWYSRSNSSNYIEADHSSFSDSLRKQAKLEPVRFAKLSLQFPIDCYPGYILGVLFSLRKTAEEANTLGNELICQVIRHYITSTDRNVIIAIVRIIESRAADAWPEDILKILSSIATSHPDPESNWFAVTNSNDSGHLSVLSLQENEMNCVRGCAAHAISALLWEQPALKVFFHSTISVLCKDKHPAVRFAAFSCLLPFYNFDKRITLNWLKELLGQDLRIIGARGFWNLMFQDYMNDRQYYRKIILNACASNIEDLPKYAAGMLCAVALFFDDTLAYEAIMSHSFSVEQQNEICRQAVHSFNNDKFNLLSKEILKHFISRTNVQIPCLGQLFYQRQILLKRDSEFLISLMQSDQSPQLLHSFLDYLNKSDEDIVKFAEVLKVLSESLVNSTLSDRVRLDVESLVQCVIRLSDSGKDSTVRSICLEIWDNLFKSNLHGIKPLSTLIDT